MTQPLFHHARPSQVIGLVEWSPPADQKGASRHVVAFDGSSYYAACDPNLTVAVGDSVSVLWVRRTLRITGLVSKAPTLSPEGTS